MSEIQKEQTLEEKWGNATIANNFIFYKVMRNNPDVCQELLEILLEFKIERIEMSQEEEINVDFGSKGIRMDVYAKDSDGQKAYNIELQAKDTKELPERARYYQGVMDVDLLKSGQDYKNLNTTFIVFICVDDIFEKGLAKYTFENLCVEDPKIKMGDRAYKYFFISQNCDKLLDEEQKAFLKMVSNNKSSNAFTDKVKNLWITPSGTRSGGSSLWIGNAKRLILLIEAWSKASNKKPWKTREIFLTKVSLPKLSRAASACPWNKC